MNAQKRRGATLSWANTGLPCEVGAGDAVDPFSVGIDVALRVDIDVEVTAGGQEVLQLDAGDLDQAVTLTRVEAGGFGVEDDLSGHGLRSPGSRAPARRS